MKPFLALLACAMLAQTAVAAEPAPPEEAAIPFIRSNGILNWRAEGDRTLYIRATSGDWYRARTMGRCGRLRTALTIGFETGGPDQLDRHGALRVQGWRCPLASVVRSEGPPPRTA